MDIKRNKIYYFVIFIGNKLFCMQISLKNSYSENKKWFFWVKINLKSN